MAFSLFSRSTQPLDTRFDTKDFGLLHEYARNHSLRSYRNALFCRTKREANIPFLLFDPKRGLYLFDYADWCFDDLRKAKATEARPDAKKPLDVNVDTAHHILREKLDASDATRSCEICNFLYLPNLDSAEFETLDPSFARLLPKSKLIFADDTLETIHWKLAEALPCREHSLEGQKVLAALLPHYALLSDNPDEPPKHPSYHQVLYIEADLPMRSLLLGYYGSGKSSLLVLKAIHEQLRDPSQKIAVLAPTVVACELMAKALLATIEHAMLPLDPTAIRILTPEQLIREHHHKTHGKLPLQTGEITPKMVRKPYRFADILFCDDAHLLPPYYLEYFHRLQQNAQLHLAAPERGELKAETVYPLPHAFHAPWALGRYNRRHPIVASRSLHRMEGNAYIHTLLLLTRLLAENEAHEILVVTPDTFFAENLREEIAGYTGCDSRLLDPDKTLLNQDTEALLLVNAGGLSALQRPIVIVVDNGELDDTLLAHAVSRAGSHAYIIAKEEANG